MMLKTDMKSADRRKEQLIAEMGSLGTDFLTRQEKIIMADLVVSGVIKVTNAMNDHLTASSKVLDVENMAVLMMMLATEVNRATRGIIDQIGRDAMADIPSARMDEFLRGLGLSPEDAATLCQALKLRGLLP